MYPLLFLCYPVIKFFVALWILKRSYSVWLFSSSCIIQRLAPGRNCGSQFCRISFLEAAPRGVALACNFNKKEALAQVFCCEFYEICRNIFFTEYLETASAFFHYIYNIRQNSFILLSVLSYLCLIWRNNFK